MTFAARYDLCSRGNDVKQGDVEPHPRGIEASPSACRHHSNTLDDEAHKLTVPALVVAGTISHPALRSVVHRLAAALSDARFVELTDCGHVTYAEQSDQFAHAVSVFASGLDRRTAAAAG